MKISCVIITLNEERCLAQVLQAVNWVDEIVVVDSGSRDKTCEIARAAGAKVIERTFSGYGSQKRFAVAAARNDWVLSLDGDEVLSEDLASRLKEVTKNGLDNAAAVAFPIENVFLGRPIRRWRGHDKLHPRLFYRAQANYNDADVHEEIQVKGKILEVTEPVWHYSYADISHYLEKMNRYTTLAAEKMHREGRSIALWAIPARGVLQFFKFYLGHGNFLSGYNGFVWSLLSSIYDVAKCLKLIELRKSEIQRGSR